jgi:hypothetical protein
MREIKFRAWKPERKRMSEAFNLKDLDGEDGGEIYTGDMSFIQINHNPTVILMQYTGLKDKHGKEIYEGDIVKLYPSDKSGVQILWDEHIAGFGFGNQTMADHLNFRKLATISYEVIGNVYENPELLEKASEPA